ncbi:MAG: YXWGXW repeat-containing protein [Edaphobacter sp.]
MMLISNFVRKLVVGAALAVVPAASFAGVFVSVTIAPPALPVYTQPLCPGDGYLWNPGYWAYGPEGYYWVPGVWVRPPAVGLLWTPGYWGWGGGAYIFHAGYWGPHVGFYGGVNYGFGYGGTGFVGGRWEGGRFAYNSAVLNVNTAVIHNTYVDRTVIVHNTVYNRTSFNGGAGGIQVHASAQENAFARENHVAATAEQQNHMQMAHADRSNFASVNGGHPQNAAFSRPGVRADNQQARIAQGVRSGQMTAGETRNVESREASINHHVAADRASNDGHMTQPERQQVNQRQNNVSQSINNDRHNANTQEHPHAEAREGGGHEPKR